MKQWTEGRSLAAVAAHSHCCWSAGPPGWLEAVARPWVQRQLPPHLLFWFLTLVLGVCLSL